VESSALFKDAIFMLVDNNLILRLFI